MKRLAVFLIALLTLVTGLFAFPLYSNQTKVNYTLANGHKLELDFFGPKEALQYFDTSVLTDGFTQLSMTYKLTNDFTVSFTPQDTGELLFLVSFDGEDSVLSSTLHPTTNVAGLRGLSLVAPRDALTIVQSWYKSYLANPNQDKSDNFVSLMRKTIFIVDYYATSPTTGKLVALAMPGTFENNTPIFDPKMDLTDYSTWINYHIRLYVATYEAALRDDYFYTLDPISDPNNPGVKRDNVMVYALFDKTAPK